MSDLKYQVIQDKEIELLFANTDFGNLININVNLQRLEILKNLRDKLDGYWMGETIFSIFIDAGLVIDPIQVKYVTLTMRGRLFLEQETNKGINND